MNFLILIIFNCKFDVLDYTKFSFLITSENGCGWYQAGVDGIPATTSSSCKSSLCAPLLQCSHAWGFDDSILNAARYFPNFLVISFYPCDDGESNPYCEAPIPTISEANLGPIAPVL